VTIFDFKALGFAAGEVAVVTGAASGIGRSTALMLARTGLTVAAWDIDEEALGELAAEIERSSGAVFQVIADLSDPSDVDRAWTETDSLNRPVKYLVNNAGPPSMAPLTVAEGVRVAIGSYAATTEGFVDRHAADASSVTFTASIAGNFKGGETADWYPAAKAGIAGYMRHVAVKFRGRPSANGVAPGPTVTPRTKAMFASTAMQERLKRDPLGRPAEGDEIAAVICFLLSPAASFVNGVLLPVDGASICAPG
jgi:NAD(P)-dependent dehydrogenase (short-subunit alcohol dehydrogenase family)